jgi:aspartate-semialdehyde dehydrogenase
LKLNLSKIKKNKQMKVAVVGITGLVGRKMLQVLDEMNFPLSELIPVATEKNIGKRIEFKNTDYIIVDIEKAIAKKPHIALFSAGAAVSKKYAPKFAENGTFVIDNSSAWRMDENIKLIVPEINGDIITGEDKIIANPNCSTIQMVMVLNPLHKKYGIERVIVSTYQSVTGSGMKGLRQLENERNGIYNYKFYPYEIDLNVLPHCDVFLENGYTKEEMKLINETRKILNDYDLKITATAVRVPVVGGHSESVYVELKSDFEMEYIRDLLSLTNGVILLDNPSQNLYPMPILSRERNEVFVGRVRRDLANPKALNLWITADNLRKGAATNAVQIAWLVSRFI